MRYLDRCDLDELAKQKTRDREAYTKSITDMNDTTGDREDNSQTENTVDTTRSDISHASEVNREGGSLVSRPSSPASAERLIATSPHVSKDEGAVSSPSSDGSHTRDVSPGGMLPRRNLNASFEAEVSSGSEYEMPQSDYSISSPLNEIEEAKEDTTVEYSTILDDPNIIKPGEHSEDYAALESDGENEDQSVYDDDEDIGANEPAAEDAAVAPDLHFNPELLGAVGGIAELARGNVHKNVLTDIKFNGWSDPSTETPYPYMHEPYDARPADWMEQDYPDIYNGESGPTADALAAAASASGAFFRFAPPHLWEAIAGASNDYFYENLDNRVAAQHAKQVARKRKKDEFQVQTPEQIKAVLEARPDIFGRELCVFVGLLIARTIAPNKEKFENHWKTTDEGAIPRGCFNPYLKRDRFAHLSRNLHFSSNSDPRAAMDRAWKLRPVIGVLQETFQANFTPPPVMAFDEAMLPSRSSFNRMRVFMKDKPHRWGTKLFMLCCSQSAYCIRFEVYCGKKQMHDNSTPLDEKSEPGAVIRNLRQVFGPSGPDAFRLIVTDRFYTSVVLAMQLLTMKFYTVGTIMMNRQGLCEAILPKKLPNGRRASNKRPPNIERGTLEVVQSVHVPTMKAVRWYDKQGVHVLATGGSGACDRIVRRSPDGEETDLMAPRIVKDYQTYMGGVDVHDQLRLQRYSLQLARRYKKYYKSLFLGLIDLVIINAFIVFNWRRSNEGKTKVSHVDFLKQLHLGLIQLRSQDWEEMLRHRGSLLTPTRQRRAATAHVPVQTDEWRKGNKNADSGDTRKRRQRACKVCSVLKRVDQARGGETTFYCGGCKLKTASRNAQAARVFLCNKVKHASNGEAISCFEIWRKHWKNGTLIPQSRGKRKIRARKPAPAAESDAEDDDSASVSDDESESGDGSHQRKRTRDGEV